jgi:hypothetical protein
MFGAGRQPIDHALGFEGILEITRGSISGSPADILGSRDEQIALGLALALRRTAGG